MDVTSISVAKAQEIEDASIVSGHINSSGSLVLVNGAGEEINAGTISVNYIEGKIMATDVFSASDNSAGPLFRTPTFDTLPPEDDFFVYHTDGITVKNVGWYNFHGQLICPQSADVSAVGLRISLFGGAGDLFNAAPTLMNQPANIGLMPYRADVMFTDEVTAANTRFYFGPFVNKVNTNTLNGWDAMMRISQAGSIVTP